MFRNIGFGLGWAMLSVAFISWGMQDVFGYEIGDKTTITYMGMGFAIIIASSLLPRKK